MGRELVCSSIHDSVASVRMVGGALSQVLYAQLGVRSALARAYRDLPARLELRCDGRLVELPGKERLLGFPFFSLVSVFLFSSLQRHSLFIHASFFEKCPLFCYFEYEVNMEFLPFVAEFIVHFINEHGTFSKL